MIQLAYIGSFSLTSCIVWGKIYQVNSLVLKRKPWRYCPIIALSVLRFFGLFPDKKIKLCHTHLITFLPRWSRFSLKTPGTLMEQTQWRAYGKWCRVIYPESTMSLNVEHCCLSPVAQGALVAQDAHPFLEHHLCPTSLDFQGYPLAQGYPETHIY